MSETDSQWRQFSQCLPLELYNQWKVQLRRIALANGISVDSWESDSKFEQNIGPKVMTLEALVILLARSDNEALRI